MRSLRAIITSAAAVALVALAITIAPAIATNAPSAKGPDPSAQELRSCLADHGVEVPDGDNLALKQWLNQHADDAAVRDAMRACDPGQPAPQPSAQEMSAQEMSAQEIRSCLADHGVEVPDGDALALKRWLGQHRDDAAYRDAMKACRLAIATKPAGGGARGVAQPNPSSN
jgi:hypothetical protein